MKLPQAPGAVESAKAPDQDGRKSADPAYPVTPHNDEVRERYLLLVVVVVVTMLMRLAKESLE